MLKRKSKTKLNPHMSSKSRSRASNCEYCQSPSQALTGTIDTIIIDSLRQKYTQAEINAYSLFNYESFTSGASRVYVGGYPQFEKVHDTKNEKKLFKKMYSISQTKQRFTKLIKKHIINDKYYLMHFQAPFWVYMLRHQSSLRVFKKVISQKNQLKEDLKSTGTGDGNKGKKHFKGPKAQTCQKNNLILEHNYTKNQSLEELRNLTKNIDKMCLKFKNRMPILIADLKKTNAKRIKSERDQIQFKKGIQQNFSFIQPTLIAEKQQKSKTKKKSSQKSRKHITAKKDSKDSKEIYGLDQNYVSKKKLPNQKISILTGAVNTFGVIEQQHLPGRTILDSPVSRAYYLKQIARTQKGEMMAVRSKRRKSFKSHRSINSLSKSKNNMFDGLDSRNESRRNIASLSKGKKTKILKSNFLD